MITKSALIAAVALFIVACGGSSSDATSTPGGSSATKPAATVAGTSKPDASPTAAVAEPTATTAAGALTVGGTASAGDLTVTLNEFRVQPEGASVTPPAPGNQYVILDVSIENTGSDPENLSSLLQWHFRDGEGQEYNTSIMAIVASGGKAPDGSLAAGDTLKAQIGYEVPADATEFLLIFDPAGGFGSGDTIRWELPAPTQ